MATKPKTPVKTTKATAKKPVVKAASPKKAETNAAPAKESGLVRSVMGIDGVATGKVTLSKELFDAEVNKQLLAQAVRVYLTNQREGSASTKTRGKVEGSSRKIYRQKGTGRARHGSIRAHIFVGGGVVFGPLPRDIRRTMTKNMKRAALTSALSTKRDSTLLVDGIEKAEKTKDVAHTLMSIGATGSILLVVPKESKELARVARNIRDLTIIAATDLNPYSVMTHKTIVFTKQSMEESKAHFTKAL